MGHVNLKKQVVSYASFFAWGPSALRVCGKLQICQICWLISNGPKNAWSAAYRWKRASMIDSRSASNIQSHDIFRDWLIYLEDIHPGVGNRRLAYSAMCCTRFQEISADTPVWYPDSLWTWLSLSLLREGGKPVAACIMAAYMQQGYLWEAFRSEISILRSHNVTHVRAYPTARWLSIRLHPFWLKRREPGCACAPDANCNNKGSKRG